MATEARRLACTVLLAVGCASPVAAPVEPPYGGIFSSYSAPLDVNFSATPVGSKVGRATVRHFEVPVDSSGTRLPIATWAELGIREAAAQGGIQTVYYADYEVLSVLGLYTEITVQVSGD